MKFNSKSVVILIVIFGFIFGLIYRDSFFNDIEKNKTETIGEIYRIRHVPKNVTGKKIYEYEFKFGGKKYTGEIRKRLSDSINVGEFYKVKLSSKNPKSNFMEFEHEYTQIIKKDVNGITTDTIYELKKN